MVWPMVISPIPLMAMILPAKASATGRGESLKLIHTHSLSPSGRASVVVVADGDLLFLADDAPFDSPDGDPPTNSL
jgi:hypothetical protein